jgi:hypothetical protein
MKRILIAAAMLAASIAMADLVATNPRGDELRLMPAACVNEAVLEQIKPEFRDKFQKAQASIGGKTFAGCWVDTGEGAYIVFFSDGDRLILPVTAFINQPGV